MGKSTTSSVKIELLANHINLIESVGELRWREWGHAPEPEDRSWWIEVSGQEAGRNHLPVTWVAISEEGDAVGAVGLGEFDIEERRDRSPWILGMIVRSGSRGSGIGRLLLAHLEEWAKSRGYMQIWVATGDLAIDFYQKCGWQLIEKFERDSGEAVLVLTKSL